MSEVGYTEWQAGQLLHRIERAVAKAEDAVAELRGIVPDADTSRFTRNLSLDGCLDEVREVGRGLQETVDRRRR